MRVDLFDFDLPPERIALRPVSPRDAARMLVVRPGAVPELTDAQVRDLPDVLAPGDALVVNDTRVFPARLDGIRRRDSSQGEGVRVEAMLHKRLGPESWLALARPGKRLAPGDMIEFTATDGRATLAARVAAKGEGGEVTLRFEETGPALDAAIAAIGHIPLPPYIAAKRADDTQDRADYQTMFAAHEGSVAAPTAGLHFTPSLIERLAARGIETHRVTLHVGAGTFLPVKADDTSDHRMHAEWGEVSPETAAALNAVKARGGRIVTVGTTATRLIESAAVDEGRLGAWRGETDIFITPGSHFRFIDGMLTNFHLPRSTLVMLVAAFIGHESQKRAYAHAIASGYRFYSYGDACLLLPQARP
ncbi:tRNA preQ1(34) S-adenosylmethionine ribosyltransferase-isomerase QueA [Ancylobacter dichloromethanicus]|uniref:S-adenosylmethionine:tRNA ribosyltransferase-isomerase n=1 Tax=Ancylobacter dichloromethanicus TaxID=518825 RepID=A0A9W6J907_9HYPH|nr:tRNA preQ1(34) S-adenosylmethionine ribosyltransferase-isomerase QueA [Ancylobacter dichloromethanicus]MBS7554479.1 tRNA preQ1(34) S-adenosylmethionine ribosyltransferase-isomerase QueA [Ancylobacter dichloromethanicus]GLK71609.1 S-adenosylmethionine:tRNA ribosyltransferase-isomerase [Ancylobacter dichloromethanicus]